MESSKIEWTQATWNPVAGCSVISSGCKHCYAMRLAARLAAMGQEKYAGTTRKFGGRYVWTGQINLAPDALALPRSWARGRMIFVNSMSDLFHAAVPESFITQVFSVMQDCHQHTFQVLTKRPERLAEMARPLPWPQNVWMGVSIESAEYLWRADYLRRVPAHVRFLSIEPLLGPLEGLNLDGIHWVIVGGESGPGARPMNIQWVRAIRDQCIAAGVPFFFKQWGGTNKKKAGRVVDGLTWDDFPSGQRDVAREATGAVHP
jgi:protein gp37